MKQTFISNLVIAAFLALAACSAVPKAAIDERTATFQPDEKSHYVLGSGDRLRITIYDEENLSGEYEVDGSGNLSLKLLGAIPATGLTLPALTKTIEDSLREGYLRDPKVAIDVLNYRPFYVLGEVNQPGKYAYVSGMTVLNAVALAGGYTYRAREEHVVVVRGSDEAKTERLVNRNAVILPGDIIRVSERFF